MFSHVVDLLTKLLHQLANDSLIELWFISSNFNLDFIIIAGSYDVDELLKGVHGFLSDPGANITSSIDSIVIDCHVECLQDFRSQLCINVLDTDCLHDRKKRFNRLFSRFSIVRFGLHNIAIGHESLENLWVEELDHLFGELAENEVVASSYCDIMILNRWPKKFGKLLDDWGIL